MNDNAAQWFVSGEEDWQATAILREAGLLAPALFHAHLALEKMLKAILVYQRGGLRVPYVHALTRLLALTGLVAPDSVIHGLVRLSPLSTLARYVLVPSGGVSPFTTEICDSLVADAEEARQWLRQQLT